MKKLSLTQWKVLLTAHIIFSSILLGCTVCFVVLGIVSLSTKDSSVLSACYSSMHILSKSSLRASTIGTVVTGILLSVLTSWGFIKFYWIIVKELLTLVIISIGLIGIYYGTLRGVELIAVDPVHGGLQSEFIVNQRWLLTGIGLQVVSLVAAFVLSVFKPWGKRRVNYVQ